MTEPNIPAGLTRDEARAVREWAERSYAAEVQDETMYHAARVLLAVLPKHPTLADMSQGERHACRWMQADVDGITRRWLILNPYDEDGDVEVVLESGRKEYFSPGRVTPRPDLPRLEWPDNQKPAPALPEGWRLAEHKDNGRVIVTNPTPTRDGRVYYVLPSDTELLGFDWHRCDPAELTYIGQGADQ